MQSRRKKLVVYGMLALGVAVLVAAAFAFKRPILEQWYLWKLESEDEETRNTAVRELGRVGSLRAVPHIFNAVSRRRLEPNRMGGERYIVAPDLQQSFNPSRSFYVPLWTIVQRNTASSTKGLVAALESDDWYVQCISASLLGRIGPGAQEAIPHLELLLSADCRALESKYPDDPYSTGLSVHRAVIYALATIGGDQSVPILARMLRHDHYYVRQWATKALGQMGSEARSAVPEIAKTGRLSESDSKNAAEALKKIQGERATSDQ